MHSGALLPVRRYLHSRRISADKGPFNRNQATEKHDHRPTPIGMRLHGAAAGHVHRGAHSGQGCRKIATAVWPSPPPNRLKLERKYDSNLQKESKI